MRFRRPSNAPLLTALLVSLAACGRVDGSSRPQATLRAQTASAPLVASLVQTPRKIELRERGRLSLSVRAPGPLTYRWSALRGFIVGTGPTVGYQPDPARQGPNQLDDVVTVRVSGPGGLDLTRRFPVDTFIGSAVAIPAREAAEWDPARTIAAPFFGTVQVTATGSFGAYDAVIAEYATAGGRRLALLGPGRTTLTGVRGFVSCYLLGPAAPAPHIQLSLSGNGPRILRPLTAAQVQPLGAAGRSFLTAPGEGDNVVDVSDARNGPVPWTNLLLVRIEEGRIHYRLLKTGDRFFGLDPRIASPGDEVRALLTDSRGGLGDNSGAWRVDRLLFD